jgi:DNA replication protein DnaC
MNPAPLRPLRPPPSPLPTEAELQAAARAHHEAAQRLCLPARMREWGIPAGDCECILTGDARSLRSPALQHVRQFRRAGRDWALVLWGGYRVGKTYAAFRWLVEAAKVPIQMADLGRTFRYAHSARFLPFSALAEAAGSFRQHHQTLVAAAIAAHALVLDDVGAQLRSAAPILAEVISARHLHRRPTLLTTNLGPDLFARPDHYGLRVALRLQENGSFRGCGGDAERVALRSDPAVG